MTAGSDPSWAAFVRDQPELAERIRERFAANLHHVLATIRPDGSPRVSGTEVSIGDEHVTIGMMPGSAKLADVRRDPRVEVHSAPLEDDLVAGDARLGGVLLETTVEHAGAAFHLLIARAVLVRVEGDELVVTSWRSDLGPSEVRRA